MNEMPVFQPAAPMFDDPPSAEAPKRNRRKPRTETQPAEPKSPKKPGPKPTRGRPAKAAKKPSGKLGINEIVLATNGLNTDQATVLLDIIASMEQLSKAKKPAVVRALKDLFDAQ